MAFLQGLMPRANIRTLSPLPPELSNATRWLSIRDMIHRHIQLLSFLAETIPADLQISSSEKCTVHALLEKREYLHALTKVC